MDIPNMNNMGGLLLGGTLLTGVVVGCWNYIKPMLINLKSLFIKDIVFVNKKNFDYGLMLFLNNEKCPTIFSLAVKKIYSDKHHVMISDAPNDYESRQIFIDYNEPSIFFTKGLFGWYWPVFIGNNGFTYFTITINGKTLAEKIISSYMKRDTERRLESKNSTTYDIKRYYVEEIAGMSMDVSNNTGSQKGSSTSNNTSSTENNVPLFQENSFYFKEYLRYDFIKTYGYNKNKFDIKVTSDNHTLLDDLYFDNTVNTMIKEIETWKSSGDWYNNRNIPWKRGWLIYGKPGTGKSVLVKAVAQHVDIPIMIFHLSTLTPTEFMKNWKQYCCSYSPCIALFEDFDNIFHGRENVVQTSTLHDKLSFDIFLNTIDGVNSCKGVFTIITTNNVDKIDSALGLNENGVASRPGRIDRVIELGNMHKENRLKLVTRILSDFPDDIENTVNRTEGMTPAQVQEIACEIALKKFWEKKNENPCAK